LALAGERPKRGFEFAFFLNLKNEIKFSLGETKSGGIVNC
jgi:hypothetical protein